MKLLTLNCHSWQEDNQMEKIKHLAQTILEKNYDVIALQEVNQTGDEKIIKDSIKKDNYAYVLLEELRVLGQREYSFYWAFSHYYLTYEEGVTILTKHPIVKKHSFSVSEIDDPHNWRRRKIAGVTLNIHNRPISFYSCHMGWWNDEEEPFAKQLDKLLENVDHNHLFFLMGDFNNNAFLNGEGYDYIINKGLYDTYHLAEEKDDGVTVNKKIAGWDDNVEDLRIDLILANQQVKVKESKVIFNNNNKHVVSDHFGVEVYVL